MLRNSRRIGMLILVSAALVGCAAQTSSNENGEGLDVWGTIDDSKADNHASGAASLPHGTFWVEDASEVAELGFARITIKQGGDRAITYQITRDDEERAGFSVFVPRERFLEVLNANEDTIGSYFYSQDQDGYLVLRSVESDDAPEIRLNRMDDLYMNIHDMAHSFYETQHVSAWGLPGHPSTLPGEIASMGAIPDDEVGNYSNPRVRYGARVEQASYGAGHFQFWSSFPCSLTFVNDPLTYRDDDSLASVDVCSLIGEGPPNDRVYKLQYHRADETLDAPATISRYTGSHQAGNATVVAEITRLTVGGFMIDRVYESSSSPNLPGSGGD